MADADLTYDFEEIPRFLEPLEDGADFVIGNRMDNIHPGAMPWLHRYIGNPLLSGVLNLFFRTGVRDAHCGMRAFRRDVLPVAGSAHHRDGVRLRDGHPGGQGAPGHPPAGHRVPPRGGESKLSSFRDGWRHLRFLLVHSPTHLFVIPGAIMAVLGALVSLTVLTQLDVLGRAWDLHSMIAGALLLIVGTQIVALGLCAHAYGTYFMGEKDPWFDWARARFRLEHGLLLGGSPAARGRRRRRGHPDHVGQARLRRAGRDPAGDHDRHARDRGHPGDLLLVPPVDTGSAPARLSQVRRRVALAAGLGGLAILTVLVVVLAQQVETRPAPTRA